MRKMTKVTKNDTKSHKKMIVNETGDYNIFKRSEKSQKDCKRSKMTKTDKVSS